MNLIEKLFAPSSGIKEAEKNYKTALAETEKLIQERRKIADSFKEAAIEAAKKSKQ